MPHPAPNTEHPASTNETAPHVACALDVGRWVFDVGCWTEGLLGLGRRPPYTRASTRGRDAIGIERPLHMLHYAIVFLIIALVAGVLGFVGIAGTAAYIAKILFVVFLVLFLISLIGGRRGPIA